jgi:hypothetical protein
VFHSFHYEHDVTRVSQVRQMGVVEGQPLVTANEWQEVRRMGDLAVANWIERRLERRTCTIVLIGTHTWTRRWVLHEIRRSWDRGMGLLGIHIHNLQNLSKEQSPKGPNPFDYVGRLGALVPVRDPPFWDSRSCYSYIAENMEAWVEHAISIRSLYP